MNGAGALFSTRLTSYECCLPPGSEWEYLSNSDCLPPGMAAWVTQHCWVGGSCGFLVEADRWGSSLAGTLPVSRACGLFSLCQQLPLGAPKCTHKPHAWSAPFMCACLQIPVCLVPEAGSESNQSHCSAISDGEFPSSFWVCVCVCVYLRVSKKKKTFWFCALSTFEGDMGPYNTEVYNLLS